MMIGDGRIAEKSPVLNAESDHFEKYNNVLTSTPISSKRQSNDLSQNSSIQLYVKKDNKRKWLPDHVPVKPARDFTFQERGRRDYKAETIQARAKSLSPERNNEFNDVIMESSRSCNERRNNKVSFNLPKHQRSQSATTSSKPQYKSRFLRNLDSSLSPVEVQEKMKTAYEEEYIKNMNGVRMTPHHTGAAKQLSFSSSQNSIEMKLSKSTKSDSPYSDEYLKIMAEIEQLKRNKINLSSDSNRTLTPRRSRSATPDSMRLKSILKPPSPVSHTNEGQRTLDIESMSNTPDDLIQRESQPGEIKAHKSLEQTLSPPESFKDKNQNYIIDVMPPCHNNSSLSSSSDEKIDMNNGNARRGILVNGCKKSSSESSDKRELKIEDLTIPYQVCFKFVVLIY